MATSSDRPTLIPRRVIASVKRQPIEPRTVSRQFDRLVQSGATLSISGSASKDPGSLWRRRLKPKHLIRLFNTDYFFTNVFQIPELRFFVAYVAQSCDGATVVCPRIIYKDLSLAWRSASHFCILNGNIWVGKGDVTIDVKGGYETVESIEATTDLPLEMQTAVEQLLSHSSRVFDGHGIMPMILRRAPGDRVEPYDDFRRPRMLAQSNTGNLINQSKPIAWFAKSGDPASLVVKPGFQPDFESGIIERSRSKSRLYGGTLKRFRILSANQQIQYYFLAGPRHVWIYPPQATTTDLSSFGVRTIDVVADDDLFIPGYEYHHWEQTDDGPELYSQIPSGFAGQVCPFDDAKADAAPWLDQIPLIRDFRHHVLGS